MASSPKPPTARCGSTRPRHRPMSRSPGSSPPSALACLRTSPTRPVRRPRRRPDTACGQRERVAPVGYGEHPLPKGHPGQDCGDEIRRLLRHPPPAPARADRPAFARQRDETLERTLIALHAQKAMREDAHRRKARNSRSMKWGSPPRWCARRPRRRRLPGARGPPRAEPCRRRRAGRREPRHSAQRLPCRGDSSTAGHADGHTPGGPAVGAQHPAQPSVARTRHRNRSPRPATTRPCTGWRW
jgi:hypothetical protein